MKFYTIGYGSRKPEEFLSLLKANGVKAIVDVRLRPDHAYLSCYAKAKTPEKGIEVLLKTAGIEYFSLVELRNIFRDYEEWGLKYKQLLERAGDLLIERITRIPTPFCMLCAEINPAACHRGLIAEYLENKGFELEHLGVTLEF